VVYEASNWNAGLAYFHANDWMNVTTEYGTAADGYSLFASYHFTPAWGVFARYDRVKPCKDLAKGLQGANCNSQTTSTYYNAGIEWIASKQIRFALVYKYDKVDEGFLATANGTLGGNSGGKYQEIGIFMQAAF
jgi:phosphate-selective porin